MLENAVATFSQGKKRNAEEELTAEKELLHAKIGQQVIAIDYLQKKFKQPGL